MQPESSLPKPPGTKAYYRGLQDLVESSKAVGAGEEVETILVSAQWARQPNWVESAKRYFFETPTRYD